MHAVVPWRTWLWLALVACAAATIAAFAYNPDILGAMRTGIAVGSGLSLLFVSTPLWRLIWLLPPIREKLPILDGVWTGVQHSNWPLIEAMKVGSKAAKKGLDVDDGAALPALLATAVLVEIRSTFFSIRMDLVSSVTKYQTSELKAAVLTPATEKARGRLTYVFQGRVLQPVGSDTDRFDGAADLEIHHGQNGALSMTGFVWTNRLWRRGLNTAGSIELKRTESWVLPGLLRGRVSGHGSSET